MFVCLLFVRPLLRSSLRPVSVCGPLPSVDFVVASVLFTEKKPPMLAALSPVSSNALLVVLKFTPSPTIFYSPLQGRALCRRIQRHNRRGAGRLSVCERAAVVGRIARILPLLAVLNRHAEEPHHQRGQQATQAHHRESCWDSGVTVW